MMFCYLSLVCVSISFVFKLISFPGQTFNPDYAALFVCIIYETVANLQLICELIDFPGATNNLPHCSTADELDIFTNNIQLDIWTEDTMNFLYRSDRSMELLPEQHHQIYQHHHIT
jgi:hypothetical protein